MPTVTFIEHTGLAHTVDAPPGRSLMQLAIEQGVPGVLGDCGGACSCATCHGYIDARWAAELPPIGESESFMLDAAIDRRDDSRLCCQIRMTEALDGLVVRLPAEQA
jgi:ferredoxin, 2Fe-2S